MTTLSLEHAQSLLPVEEAHSLPAYLAPHQAYWLMDALASHAAKMITLLALRTTPDEFLTGTELARRMDTLQGDKPGWSFDQSITVPMSYCLKSLEPAGLVELGVKEGYGGKPAQAVRINELGNTIGAAIAGSHLWLEKIYPNASQQGIQGSLRHSGAAPSSDPATYMPPARIGIYTHLLASPEGAASAADLHRSTGLGRAALTEIIQGMADAGIVEKNTKVSPAERIFLLTEPAANLRQYVSRMRPETRICIESILDMQGQDKTDGGAILAAARERDPEIDLRKTWDLFLRWVREPDRDLSFIQEAPFAQSNRARTRIQLTATHLGYIEALLHTRRLLAGQEPKCNDFRKWATDCADEIISSPHTVAQLLAKSRQHSGEVASHPTTPWTQFVDALIPPDGIAIKDLHALVNKAVGKPISYKTFRAFFANNDGYNLTAASDSGNSTSAPIVTARRSLRDDRALSYAIARYQRSMQ